MLAKKYKLSKKDFGFLLRKGKRISLNWLGLVYLKNPKPIHNIGIIISAKAIKKATERNALKREIFHLIQSFVAAISDNNYKILLRIFREPGPKEKEEAFTKLTETLKKL